MLSKKHKSKKGLKKKRQQRNAKMGAAFAGLLMGEIINLFHEVLIRLPDVENAIAWVAKLLSFSH
jgi:hypothetical protein